MASLYITEYKELAEAGSGVRVQAGAEPAVKRTKLAFTTSTAHAFASNCHFVRLVSDADCYLEFVGDTSTPTATASSSLMKANVVEFFGVRPNSKMAVYDGVS
ncbi:MAG: hypothetical protein ACE5FS_03490 [Paracoccaceae bacterium]